MNNEYMMTINMYQNAMNALEFSLMPIRYIHDQTIINDALASHVFTNERSSNIIYCNSMGTVNIRIVVSFIYSPLLYQFNVLPFVAHGFHY